MAYNYGKKFEDVIREAFEKVPGVSIDRLHDQTTHYKGSSNICDFIVYREPYEYYFECKSVHGNTLPISNITATQWNGLLAKSFIEGVTAGVICWWVDKNKTAFIPIQMLQAMLNHGKKSISHEQVTFVDSCGNGYSITIIDGKKKRVFFDYNLGEFLDELSRSC